jgi:hypothetical protein
MTRKEKSSENKITADEPAPGLTWSSIEAKINRKDGPF